MSMGQMLLVLMGLVLFSTLIIAYYNTLSSQIEWVEENQIQQQALKILDFNIQLFESQLISQRSLSDIYTQFPDFNTPVDTMNVNSIDYVMYIKAHKCTEDGTILSSGIANYIRLNMRIVAYRTATDSVMVGTVSNPIFKIFGDVFGTGVN